LVNAALYVMEHESLEAFLPSPHRVLDFGKHLLPKFLACGRRLFGYLSPEYIKDVGTPDRLDAVSADYDSGKILCGSFETAAPAVFLDRDGTMNREVNRVKSVNELVLLEGVAAAIRELNRAGCRVVVVSNQPVIARGDCAEAELRAIHNRMETLLGREGAYVDRIYYCPHHPDGGFDGERPELKIPCNCRKPATGLIDIARRELNLDLGRSWLIGDSTSDIRTARNAGLRSILVRTGHGGDDRLYPDVPDVTVPTLLDAVHVIVNIPGALPSDY
jgi:histidinol-phosphate phosphatase family protein